MSLLCGPRFLQARADVIVFGVGACEIDQRGIGLGPQDLQLLLFAVVLGGDFGQSLVKL